MKGNSGRNSKEPLISIITVTYNAEPFLEETINSVLNQDYKNIEYIIVDGGSTDGTVDIIKKFGENITYWISEPDNGIYHAMNKAVKVVKGEWVYFLGAGDILYNVFHRLVPNFVNRHYVYYGDVYRKDLSSVYDGKFSPFKLAVINICHQAIFYPAGVFGKYKYIEKYRVFADHVLNMEIYGDKDYKFQYVPITICVYEGDGFSVRSSDKSYVDDKMKIIKANFSIIVFMYAFIRRVTARLIRSFNFSSESR